MRYVQSVGPRARIIGYGGSLGLVLIGVLVAILRTDSLGMAGAVALISVGLVAATSLVFYEVGLSEDRARARESQARRPPPDPTEEPASPQPPRRLVRPGRTRGSR
ncbi:MAG: hypothetical protein QOH12_1283 [Solirubrobacteraceae bacterium]|nr:hypothetical protein [Solirubrobacteraceae bacterium]